MQEQSLNPNETGPGFGKWRRGWPGAIDRLMPLVLPTLRQLAKTRFSHTQTMSGHVEKLGDLYIRLAGNHSVEIRSRGEFFYAISVLMRRFLVDNAERSVLSLSGKRTGIETRSKNWGKKWSIQSTDLTLLDRSLDKLEEIDFRHGVIVGFKIFLGMSDREISEVLNMSEGLVRRQWILARTWLRREMKRRL